MCGIAGILNFNQESVNKEVVKLMTDIIAHRGPDGEGIWCENNIGLGHRRLSIIDLSDKASQPMHSANGRYTIVFNGEIYNYKELQIIIKEKNIQLRTNSDTEVIICLFSLFDVESFKMLRGMFAFALWDNTNRNLYLVRDRIGIKPLYYLLDNEKIVFASEIKGILASGYSMKEIDGSALIQYMRFLCVPQPESIFKDIRKLNPASYMKVTSNGLVTNSVYWDIKDYIPVDNGPKEEKYYIDKTDQLFTESVRYHMVSDVPVAAFLSGGLDSSAVVSMMRKNYPILPISTFSIVFPAYGKFDESIYAEEVAILKHTKHTEFKFTPDFINDFDKITWHLDEPFAISSAFATYYLAQSASREAKVVLTGDGGDELFAGYEGYANNNYFKKEIFSTRLATNLLSSIISLEKKLKTNNKYVNKLIVGLGRRVGNKGIRFSEQMSQSSLFVMSKLLPRDIFMDSMKIWYQNLYAEYYNSIQTEDLLIKKLYSHFKTRLVDEMLMKVDRMTMAHSLEARVPVLDHKIAEFAFSLPSGFKLNTNKNVGKYIIKKTMEKYLPGNIVYRAKHGFDVPISDFYDQKNINKLRDKILSGNLVDSNIIQKKGVEYLFEEYKLNKSNFYNMPILLFTLESWLEVYQNRFGKIVIS